jgi:hypothetical protein
MKRENANLEFLVERRDMERLKRRPAGQKHWLGV